MNKVKIIGVIILIVTIALAIISYYLSEQNQLNTNILKTINLQKAFTQEISKNIFYIYKNKNKSTIQLEKSIENFLNNMDKRDNTLIKIESNAIKQQSDKIVLLWNKFYLDVQKFRTQSKTITTYSNIILEQTVKNIYNVNLSLIIEFDKLMLLHQE